jgi:hypothetical protein
VNYKKFLPFLFAFVLPLVVVYAWWGGFNSVSIEKTVAGPYTYAYLEQTGDYSKLTDLAGQVRGELVAAKVAFGNPITVLYSNPDLVNVGERKARTGFLVPAGTRVPLPLMVDTIPRRAVLVTRIHAGSLLAPGRAYAALDHYLQSHGQGIRMPTVELYQPARSVLEMGWLSVEMESN